MEWKHAWSREYGVQYCEVILLCASKQGDSISSVCEYQLFYPEHKNEAHHFSHADWERLHRTISESIRSETYDREVKRFLEHGEVYLSLSRSIAGMDLASEANARLLELYLKYRRKWIDYSSHLQAMFWFAEFVGERIEALLRHKMNSLSEKEFERLAYLVSQPEQKVGVLALNDELSALSRPFDEARLRELHFSYAWISCLDLHTPPMSWEDFSSYCKRYAPPVIFSTEGVALQLTDEERHLVRLNQHFAYIKDLRDYYRRKSVMYVQTLFGEIGKRMGLTLKQVSYTTSHEIISFLREGKRPDPDPIEKRIHGFLMYPEGEGLRCITDAIPQEARKLGFEWRVLQEESIRGKVASRGKIQSIARIVHRKEELVKVQVGDVLVVITTDASYIAAMAKAAAFVTDQGGILSHAAILAREMKKPCIVGTGNATKLLKDGDLIELDDETGEVRKVG